MSRPPRIGVDFDNTIVCYDAVFHALAVAKRWVPPAVTPTKQAIRAYLRAAGREDQWTELQGEAYGAAMSAAPAFAGAPEFFAACVRREVSVCIISHRTRHPYAGPPFDLHVSAQRWLDAMGFFDPQRVGLAHAQVFFEETPEEKLRRVVTCECTHFIDDLPEFLAAPGFPLAATRIHFDPRGEGGTPAGCTRVDSWRAISRLLLASGSAAA
jgi:hypothetical protein